MLQKNVVWLDTRCWFIQKITNNKFLHVKREKNAFQVVHPIFPKRRMEISRAYTRSADIVKGSYPGTPLQIRWKHRGTECQNRNGKKDGVWQLNGIIIEHFVAKGIVTSLRSR